MRVFDSKTAKLFILRYILKGIDSLYGLDNVLLCTVNINESNKSGGRFRVSFEVAFREGYVSDSVNKRPSDMMGYLSKVDDVRLEDMTGAYRASFACGVDVPYVGAGYDAEIDDSKGFNSKWCNYIAYNRTTGGKCQLAVRVY